MSPSIQIIPFAKLALMGIPVMVVIVILFKWSLNARNAAYAISRMLVQLLLIGYLLTFIFETDRVWVVMLVLSVMVFTSSWISLRTVKTMRHRLYTKSLCSIFIGGGCLLILVTQGVLELRPWYLPRYMIPLAGMIFANSMNSVSLAAERLTAEMERGVSYQSARAIAFRAALIPITNSMFAVGLVSLPGMMTGQILSGISPLIAVRYQIMVMCMLYGASGISSSIFLMLVKKQVS